MFESSDPDPQQPPFEVLAPDLVAGRWHYMSALNRAVWSLADDTDQTATVVRGLHKYGLHSYWPEFPVVPGLLGEPF
jgi:hypothetical protein